MSTIYAGNPDNYPASVQIPSGSDTPNTANIFAPVQGNSDRASWLNAQLVGLAWSRWSSPTTATSLASGTSFVAAAWDEANGRWLAIVDSGSNWEIFESIDLGVTWTNLVSFSGDPAYSIATANGTSVVAITDAFTYEVAFLDATDVLHSATPLTIPASIAVAFPLPFPLTAGTAWGFLSIYQTGGTFAHGYLFVSSDGLTFATAGALPTDWLSGTNHVGQLLVATSPTTIVAAMCGVTPGTDTALLLKITSSGGTAVFAELTPPSTIAGYAVIVTGLAYDALNQTWGCLFYNGTSTFLWVTKDLATWTLAHTWTGKVTGLAAYHGVWAACVPYVLTPDSTTRVAISADVSSASSTSTWRWAPMVLASMATLVPGGGGSLFAFSPAAARVSAPAGLM